MSDEGLKNVCSWIRQRRKISGDVFGEKFVFLSSFFFSVMILWRAKRLMMMEYWFFSTIALKITWNKLMWLLVFSLRSDSWSNKKTKTVNHFLVLLEFIFYLAVEENGRGEREVQQDNVLLNKSPLSPQLAINKQLFFPPCTFLRFFHKNFFCP